MLLRGATRVDCDKAVGQNILLKQLSQLRVCSVLEAAYGECSGDELEGTEARRFRVPCGAAVGGNEADGGMSEDGRIKQVMDRLSDFGGGVGGVDIHVGGVKYSLGNG